MEAAKLEGVHSGLSRSDCGLRQPTPSLTPANATVPYDALGQGEQAREYYLKALEIAERLAQQDPGNAGWQRDVWTALWRLASIPGSKMTWALTRMEAMKARGMLVPSDEEFLQEARTRVRT
jgi:hypothetical protein